MLTFLRRVMALALLLAALLAAVPAFAKAGITSIWEPGYNQLEVFYVGGDGAVRTIWKGADGYWHQPQQITPENWGMPGSEITALWSVMNDQLEVFWLDGAGALNVVWKDHNKAWHSPAKLTGPGFAAPGSPLTGFWQPTYHQLHVFGITPDGAIAMLYKVDNKAWNPPARMTAPGVAAAGSQMAALYQPTGAQSLLFYTAPNGSVGLTWKAANGRWQPPAALTNPGMAAPGAWLTASYYAAYDQSEVFYTGPRGHVNVTWKHGAMGKWNSQTISIPNFSPPGAPITSGPMPADNHLEVFSIGSAGTINDVWKQNNGGWQPAFATSGAGSSVPGNTISATLLPNPAQLEVFYQDANGAIWVSWKGGNNPWAPAEKLTGDNGTSKVTRDYCLAYWRDWYAGNRPAEINMGLDCQKFAPAVCRWWHMTNPASYIYNDDNLILLLMHSRVRDMSFADTFKEKIDQNGVNSFGGPILAYKGTLGGNAKNQLHGKIYSGHFNVYTGHIGFLIHLWDKHDGDGSYPAYNYGADITEILPDPSGKGNVFAYMQGGFFSVDGKHPGTWYAPYPDHPPLVFCAKDDLNIAPLAAPLPLPNKPIKLTPKADNSMPLQPAPAVNVSFSGSWVTRLQSGVIYNMQLTQDTSGHVSGDYGFGKISNGVVVGRDLFAVWTQGQASGTVMFHLAPDGTTFAGMWAQGSTVAKPSSATAKGSWDGYSSNVFTKVTQIGDFNGTFALSRNLGESIPLTLTINGGTVSGSYAGGSFSGTVTRRQGRAVEFDGNFRDGSRSGPGSLYLYPNGAGLSGYWHSAYADLNAWSAKLVSAPPPTPTPPPAIPDAVQVSPAPVVPAAPVAVVPVTPGPAPKPIVLPQGQCPAPTASAISAANIRAGSNGDVIGNLPAGTRVQCSACDKSWCLIATNDPSSTVSRKLLQFETPQPVTPVTPDQPPEQQQPQQQEPEQQQPAPAPVANADFTGKWWVRTSSGLIEQFDIHQQGTTVVGTYVDQNGTGGQITGGVGGQTASVQWVNNRGYAGPGFFTMHADGKSFDGKFAAGNIPPFQQMPVYSVAGTWESFVPQPAAPQPVDPDQLTDYGGCSSCNPVDKPDPVK